MDTSSTHLPHSGFYSVQDEANRIRKYNPGHGYRYKYKHGTGLMKYRYSDETEKSQASPNQADPDSFIHPETPGEGDPSRRSQDEEARRAGGAPSTNGPTLSELIARYDEVSPGLRVSRHLPDINTRLSPDVFADSDEARSPSIRGEFSPGLVNHPAADDDNNNSEEIISIVNMRKPKLPPPYTEAIRSSKRLSGNVTNGWQYNSMTADTTITIARAEPRQIRDSSSDSDEPNGLGNVIRPQPRHGIALAQYGYPPHNQAPGDFSPYVSSVNAEGAAQKSPSSGIIITSDRERRTSSPDRHIRFHLDKQIRSEDTENYEIDDSKEATLTSFYDSYLQRNAQPMHPVENVEDKPNTSPSNEYIFRFPPRSADKAVTANIVHNYANMAGSGIDNAGFEHSSTDIPSLHIATQLGREEPLRKEILELNSRGYRNDSSQSSTMDSVFTERSWSSDRGKPRVFREKRRVHPKPKDPIGDMGDGLKATLAVRDVTERDIAPSRKKPSFISAQPKSLERRTLSSDGSIVRHTERSRSRTELTDPRKSLIRRELELYMKREKARQSASKYKTHVYPPRRHSDFQDSRHFDDPYYGHDWWGMDSNMTKGINDPLNDLSKTSRNHRNGADPVQRSNDERQMGGGNRPHNTKIHHPKAVYRHNAPRAQQSRPYSYPNDLNRPSSHVHLKRDIGGEQPPPSRSVDQLEYHAMKVLARIYGPTHQEEHVRRYDIQRASRDLYSTPKYPSYQGTRPNIRGDAHLSTHVQRTSHLEPNIRAEPLTEPSAVQPRVKERNVLDTDPFKDFESKDTRKGELWGPKREPKRHQANNLTGFNEQAPTRQPRSDPALGQTERASFTNWRFFSTMAAIWFFPIGIWALRKSKQVDSRVAAKDIPGAKRASKSARNHSIAAFVVLGIIVLIIVARVIEVAVDPQKSFLQNYQIVPDEEA